MKLSLDSDLKAAPHIRWRRYEQGGILLDTLTGEVFKLNASGMYMWQLLVKGHSLRAVATALVDETGTERAQVQADIEAFVTSLLDQGVLCVPERARAGLRTRQVSP
jgi:hypothetical protein